MIANLVKKDFLLVKKTTVAFLGISVLVPLLATILMRDAAQDKRTELFIFLYMVILVEVMFVQAVATEEEKSPRATALLCAAPYSRKSYVIAKYICYLIFYGTCIAIYSIIAAIYPGLGFLNITEVLTVFLVGTILYGVYIPVAIKYGITKARLVFATAILLVSLGPTLIAKVFNSNIDFVLSLMRNISSLNIPIILGVAGVGVFLVSMIISFGIFEKKEL